MPVPTRRSLIATAIVVAVLAVTAVAMLEPPDPLPHGWRGRYFTNAEWSGEPVLERLDASIDTELLAATSQVSALERFSVEWTGYLVVRDSQIYRFATKSDDGSLLWIGDRMVVDNGGPHPAANATGDIFLERGVHPIRVRYSQHGADRFLQLGQSLTGGMLPPAPVVPDPIAYDAYRLRELWSLNLVAVWYAAAIALGALLWPRLRQLAVFRELSSSCADPAFRALAVLGVLLAAAHIGYGLPAPQFYAPDELDALYTLQAGGDGFRTWNLRWPPLHAYTVAGVLLPFRVAEMVWNLPLADAVVYGAMTIVMRSLSVLMLGTTLLLTFDATRLLFDRAAAICSVVLLATAPAVVFFGALANLELPHLFWVTVTFWVWTRLFLHRSAQWFLLLGITTGLSVGAKDQAVGYYYAAPVALWWVVRRDAGLLDRRLLYVAAGSLAALALAHGLPWRLDRFIERLPVLTGPASTAYRMYPATAEGQLQLFGATLKSVIWAAGVPLTVAFVGGAVWMFGARQAQRLMVLLVPVLTYYAGFLAVIGYVYDRFLIAWLPIMSAVGGLFVAKLVAARTALRVTTGGALLAMAALNAVAVNVVFHRDPKDDARRWLASNLPCGTTVGITYDRRFVPPLDCYDVWMRRAGEAMQLVHNTDYLVLNEAYVRRFSERPAGREFLAGLHSGALGFDRVYRAEVRPPLWAPLYWESRFWNGVEDSQTTADKPLHAIDVWRRRTPRPAS